MASFIRVPVVVQLPDQTRQDRLVNIEDIVFAIGSPVTGTTIIDLRKHGASNYLVDITVDLPFPEVQRLIRDAGGTVAGE